MTAFDEARERHRELLASVPNAEGHLTMKKVIEHHAPVDQIGDGRFTICNGCDPGWYAEESAGWPCSTIRLIAADFNVTLPS